MYGPVILWSSNSLIHTNSPIASRELLFMLLFTSTATKHFSDQGISHLLVAKGGLNTALYTKRTIFIIQAKNTKKDYHFKMASKLWLLLHIILISENLWKATLPKAVSQKKNWLIIGDYEYIYSFNSILLKRHISWPGGQIASCNYMYIYAEIKTGNFSHDPKW